MLSMHNIIFCPARYLANVFDIKKQCIGIVQFFVQLQLENGNSAMLGHAQNIAYTQKSNAYI